MILADIQREHGIPAADALIEEFDLEDNIWHSAGCETQYARQLILTFTVKPKADSIGLPQEVKVTADAIAVVCTSIIKEASFLFCHIPGSRIVPPKTVVDSETRQELVKAHHLADQFLRFRLTMVCLHAGSGISG